jgi:DNA-directed RNA polymerase specialized sigma subunit
LTCTQDSLQIVTTKFILIIETINKILDVREKYVVFTYLYCEKKQPDALIHLDKKIAFVLNTTEGNVRRIKSTAYAKVRKFLNNLKSERIF